MQCYSFKRCLEVSPPAPAILGVYWFLTEFSNAEIWRHKHKKLFMNAFNLIKIHLLNFCSSTFIFFPPAFLHNFQINTSACGQLFTKFYERNTHPVVLVAPKVPIPD